MYNDMVEAFYNLIEGFEQADLVDMVREMVNGGDISLEVINKVLTRCIPSDE